MLINKIKVLLGQKGFQSVKVNVEEISLSYKVVGNSPYLILLLEDMEGNRFTKEQYNNIIRQIKGQFLQKGYDTIQLLSILVTENLDIIRNLMNDEESYWIIDTSLNRLIIYENQPSSYLGLENDIENLLIEQGQGQGIYDVNNQGNQYDYPINNKYNREGYNRSPNDRYKTSMKKGRTRSFTICNTAIIVINILVFLWVEFTGSSESVEHLIKSGGMYWPYVINDHQYYRLITYMFLHGGISHIVNNMLVLGVLGDNLERALGKVKYVILYFATGIIAGLVSMGYNMYMHTEAVSVGASGAIFGVVGAMVYIVMANRGRLEDLSTSQLIIFVILSLYAGFTSQGTDNMAHVGGFISGFILSILLYRKPRKRGVSS